MNNQYLFTFIISLSSLFTSIAFAERPAEFETSTNINQTETSPVMDDRRPAAEYTSPQAVTENMHHSADTLNMPVESAVQAIRQMNFPRRGMTQDKVQNELGRPLEIIPAIGKPPISRWVYNDRIVFFEYSSVLHVVAK